MLKVLELEEKEKFHCKKLSGTGLSGWSTFECTRPHGQMGALHIEPMINEYVGYTEVKAMMIDHKCHQIQLYAQDNYFVQLQYQQFNIPNYHLVTLGLNEMPHECIQ